MGFETKLFVRSIDENLICSICDRVLKDPYGCKDGHSFCKDCITEWLSNQETCPIDRNRVQEENLVRNTNVKNLIQNLEVWCDPPAGRTVESLVQRCEWRGKLRSLERHREDCLFQHVQCPNENCKETIQRKDMDDHDTRCEHKVMECNKCRKQLLRRQLEDHSADECPETLIPCPNNCIRQGQIQEIKRVDLDHLKNMCAKTILDCPFKDQGCSVQVERQHVDKHVQDNMAEHMMLLAQQCSSLTQKNKALEESLRQVEKLNSSYKWTIKDFSTLCTKHPNGSAFTSPIFWLRGHRLNFLVYPNGVTKEAEGWLSLYLEFSEEYPKPPKVFNKIPNVKNTATVIYRLSIKSIEPETDDVSKEETHVLKEPESWGWSEMIKTTEALSTAYCNSTDGSLTIQCTIQLDKPQ